MAAEAIVSLLQTFNTLTLKWFSISGDLAAVVPVAVATLTPFPLLAALIYYNVKSRLCPADTKEKELQDMSSKDKEARISLVLSKEDSNQNMTNAPDTVNLIPDEPDRSQSPTVKA